MDIKEVEKNLSVTRANIRYYEKEGLISPIRKQNNYRDYSDKDIAELKKVLVLRKIGFSIKEIKDMQERSLSLADALNADIERLNQAIEELQGSLEVAKTLESEHTDFEKIDTERYWNLINDKEKNGAKFTDLFRDYAFFELDIFDRMWKYVFFFDFKKFRENHGIVIVMFVLLAIFVVRGISSKYLWHESFWEGALYPVGLFVIGSIIFLPIYILSKKHPKTASILSTILFVAGITFLIALVLYIVICIIVSVIK